MNNRHLRIYLNDHLALLTGTRALAQRCRRNNRQGPLAALLATLIDQLASDETELRHVMARLDVTPDRLKQTAAQLMERLGRLKLNGQLLRYSDLSRLLELEGVALGLGASADLWRSLAAVASGDARLAGHNFWALMQRAELLRQPLEEQRQEAALRAFGGGEPRPAAATRPRRPDGVRPSPLS